MDSEYFSSYFSLSVHQLMLTDRPRTLAYRHAIAQCRPFLENKIVLDVGCGTGDIPSSYLSSFPFSLSLSLSLFLSLFHTLHQGILSLFALESGAAKVYGVEASEMAAVAERNGRENGYGEDRFEVLHGRYWVCVCVV